MYAFVYITVEYFRSLQIPLFALRAAYAFVNYSRVFSLSPNPFIHLEYCRRTDDIDSIDVLNLGLLVFWCLRHIGHTGPGKRIAYSLRSLHLTFYVFIVVCIDSDSMSPSSVKHLHRDLIDLQTVEAVGATGTEKPESVWLSSGD